MDCNPAQGMRKDDSPNVAAGLNEAESSGNRLRLFAGDQAAAHRPPAASSEDGRCAATGRGRLHATVNDEGGRLSNTHPHTSQVGLEGFPECQAAGGFDWLEWAAAVEWKPPAFERLIRVVESAKVEAQEAKVADVWAEFPGVGEIRVSRMGMNRGGDRGQHFEFKVCYRGVWIGLARRQSGSGKLPNVYVRQTGRDCLLLGASECYGLVREFIRRLGASIELEKLTRADLCLDVAGLDVSELQAVVERQQFVTRAQRVHTFVELVSEVRSGLSVGARPLRLVIYDKLVEQEHKCDYLYFAALVERRWGGMRPEKAGRIEFQVSRDRLVRYGIDSPADLFRLAGSLVEALATDWFRLTAEPVDRRNNHQSRVDTLPLWRSISKAFATVFGHPAGQLLPIDRTRIDPVRLLRQARGCLVSALLQMGEPVKTYDDFVFATAQRLYALEGTPAEQLAFLEEYRRREMEHAA